MLVLIGADASGKNELLAIDDGFRESEQSWHELLIRLRDHNGLALDPELTTGDGALGFWKAARKVWPNVHQQRCWVHKTGNLLKCRGGVRSLPRQVSGEIRQGAHCLAKNRQAFLAFYDFPAEHWKHIRTVNPIESAFAPSSTVWVGEAS